MDIPFQKPHPLLRLVLALALVCLNAASASADAAARMPGVSFSPTVIDFGQIPSDEQPTQLLTVTFDRHLFAPEHLPSLRPQGPNGPTLALFSRSVGLDTITLVYRVMLPDDGEYGQFHYRLVLVKEGARLTEDAAMKYVVDSGVVVQGEIVQGLEGKPGEIDFGPVRYGKGAVREFEVGFYHSDMIQEDELPSKPPKAEAWSMFRSLRSMTVTSTSPYFTALNRRGMGMDASAWDIWQIVLSAKAPQKKLEAELTFQTGDGYSLTVPVSADLSGPGYPIPPWEPGKRRKQ